MGTRGDKKIVGFPQEKSSRRGSSVERRGDEKKQQIKI